MSGRTPFPPKPRRKRGLAPEEHALWAHVARSTRPLPGRALPELPPEPPKPESHPAPPRHPPAEPARRAPSGLMPLVGVEKRLTKALARGTRAIDARIDLHGMRQAEAHQALHGFIHRAQAEGARIVLVITGKGGEGGAAQPGRDERGILRRMVPHWLADPALRRLVVGFDEAARGHGGEGALYVRLRRPGRGA